jgi:tRNA pseudouridine13 synthase
MRIRSEPEDFVVDEIPLYPPSGEGDHSFVRIEKRGLTTEAVARALARHAGVRPRDVGYAGRKDRVAVTRQWFSLPGVAPERLCGFGAEGFRVLEAARHRHKLRTGHLAGNRFEIVVRELQPLALAAAPERLEVLVRRGMPNRFGAQRFGRDGANPERARALLGSASVPTAAPRPRLHDRRASRFLLSALQAELFNAVLAARTLPLDSVEAGDVAVVHASGGLFVVEQPEDEAPRAARFEISATGPIFGSRAVEPRGAPARREAEQRAGLGIPPDAELRPPRGIRLRGARRPLRVRPEEVACEPIAADSLRLRFRLPPGSYATVLIEELFGTTG